MGGKHTWNITNFTATPQPEDSRQLCQWTLLHAASLSTHPEVVDLLLGAGAEVDAPCVQYDGGKETPLLRAVANIKENDRPDEAVEVVRILLEAGADTNTVGLWGRTVLIDILDSRWASPSTLEVLKMLLEHGVDPNTVHPPRRILPISYLYRAKVRHYCDQKWEEKSVNETRCENATLEVAKLLLAAGADPNLRVCQTKLDCGDPALVQAGQGSYLSVVKLLVEAGANIWSKSSPYYSRTEEKHIWSDSWGLPETVQQYFLQLCRERLQVDARDSELGKELDADVICARNHTDTNINAPNSFYYT